MTEQEKHLVVMTHALSRQETEIQYLKAVLMEKRHMKIEEYQKEENAFWQKSQHYRIFEAIKTFQALHGQLPALPEQLDWDMYRDHLRWPTDIPTESSPR